MDGSGQDNEAVAGEQPHLVHVLSRHPLFSSVQARVDDILGHAPNNGNYYEDIMIRIGGLASRIGGFGGHAYRGGEVTHTGPVASRDTDGSGQNNDMDAGEQPQVLVASSYEDGFFDGGVVLVPQDENVYLIEVRRVGGNGGQGRHVNGYGDDAYRGGGFGAVPASEDEIARLEKATVGDTREAECVVCMEGFEEGDEIRKMPCSHGFHETCIFKWLRVSRLCPHCRFALPPKDNW